MRMLTPLFLFLVFLVEIVAYLCVLRGSVWRKKERKNREEEEDMQDDSREK